MTAIQVPNATSATVLFCDVAKNQCDNVPYCSTTDGTAANPANCACGTTDCDAATTGLFCFSAQNVCAGYAHPRKVYPVVTSGTCADNGYGWLEDAATCEAAAGQVGWSYTTANTYSTSSRPRGCYDAGSSSGSRRGVTS